MPRRWSGLTPPDELTDPAEVDEWCRHEMKLQEEEAEEKAQTERENKRRYWAKFGIDSETTTDDEKWQAALDYDKAHPKPGEEDKDFSIWETSERNEKSGKVKHSPTQRLKTVGRMEEDGMYRDEYVLDDEDEDSDSRRDRIRAEKRAERRREEEASRHHSDRSRPHAERSRQTQTPRHDHRGSHYNSATSRFDHHWS